jgi:hypothetical protein
MYVSKSVLAELVWNGRNPIDRMEGVKFSQPFIRDDCMDAGGVEVSRMLAGGDVTGPGARMPRDSG